MCLYAGKQEQGHCCMVSHCAVSVSQ